MYGTAGALLCGCALCAARPPFCLLLAWLRLRVACARVHVLANFTGVCVCVCYVDVVVSARLPHAGVFSVSFYLFSFGFNAAVLCLLADAAYARGCCVCLAGVALFVVLVCLFVVACTCSGSA